MTFTLPDIYFAENRVFLVELGLKKESEKSVDVTVILNSQKITNIRYYSTGKKKYFIKIPRSLLSEENILEFDGSSRWKLESLEIKNLYGYSSGLMTLIILDRNSTDYGSLALLPLCLIFITLVPGGYFLAEKELIRSTGKLYKFLSIFLVLFLSISFLLPVISKYRILFSLKTFFLFLAIIYFPLAKKPIKSLYLKLKTVYEKFITVHFPLLKTKLTSPRGKNVLFYTLLTMMIVSVSSIYVIYRQQYVGACDWFGYYNQAQLMRSLKIHQETRLNPLEYPAVAPLSYYAIDGKTLPQYPPGFPLLLALSGFLGLEYFVTPMIGILSLIVIYLLIMIFTSDRWIALMFSTLWAFAPIVHYGSISIMSDLVAAFFIMLSFYLFYQEKLRYSGLALGFSLAVRPTNILFCILFLVKLLRKKPGEWFKFGLFFSIPTSLYGLYNWLVYGLPWKSGYPNQYSDLVSYVFMDHLQFYLKELVVQLTPFLIFPAIIPFFKKRKYSYFFGAWFLIFFVFYCFWKPRGDEWWWTRFLLPGLPPLFLLSAMGVKEVLGWAKTRWKHAARYIGITCAALTLTIVAYFIDYGINM